MKTAVIGATGLVGREMLKMLDELHFPVTQLIPSASEKSAGMEVSYKGSNYKVVTIQKALEMRPDVALFSAGGSVSKEWAPRFAEQGCTVIDNSSAWRMEEHVPLVVPEINLHTASKGQIIANPNCSTIQMVMVLAPLHQHYHIRRVVISTYQAVTGTGKLAVEQLEGERAGRQVNPVYPHPIDMNVIPQCDSFLDNGYTKEEMKLVNETRKILGDPSIRITSTTVRVPVTGGHSESVNIEFAKPFELHEINRILSHTPGVVVYDDPSRNIYPTPRMAHNKNDVFVGRIRRDESADNALNLWIVADNLRKGAATNAVQIAKGLFA